MLKDLIKMIQLLKVSEYIKKPSLCIATDSLTKLANFNFNNLLKVSGALYSPNSIIVYL